MGVIGIFLVMCCIGTLTTAFLWDDEDLGMWIAVAAVGFLIGGALCLADSTSPIETTERIVITNDYDEYDMNIASDKLGKIRIIEKTPTRTGAVFGEETIVEFIDFIE